ncbi:tetratricopeptide repeat protein [Mucilaginibacter sp. PPCGB 2223]|uniref:type IX secretion system periplasmic lipoprotein PorW/SprE n=1 Tax=Mucilaginibacter sp. PPCGB 2223 TaxID=1886027 RepID=UPI0015863498|nr:tetratricopeptide repeat protein [Mucilaginibacter sp. PPCGB 2223]
MLLFAACNLEKESGFNRMMQNLTARYNILFNANEVLRQHQETMALNYVDNYGQLLSVYQDTAAKSPAADKALTSVIERGNTLIAEKEQSHYIPDAYMLLGKANFLQYNYYNAIEFFSYVIRTYPKSRDLVQEARVWKARALMHTDQLAVADTLLDTALQNIFPKEQHTADVYATKLQYDIYAEKYADAEAMAAQAVHFSRDINHKLRWTFILAQLQELNHKPAEAVKNYSRVMNSNASFEMAFNASLNKIRIEDTQAGDKTTRIDRLRKLLKNENNKEFIDQIYYQIGEIYLAQGNYNEAIKNYQLSIRNSTKNQDQKGLSYLRVADINFKNKADYATAKKYYDSTLTNLSPTYPGYQTIRKKADNLQLLADRLQTIAREDTLQMLAKLNEKDRAAKITALASGTLLQQQAIATASKNVQTASVRQQSQQGGGLNATGNFYFYNTQAVAQGYTDFKRIWGNRPLTDNWRRSVQSNNNTTTNPSVAAIAQQNTTASPDQVAKPAANPALTKLENDLAQNVPLTPAQLTLSNTKIYNAYLDIANFYRDVLEDNKEAIGIFELLLQRFPNTVNKPSVYYNLYRLYSDIDKAKSDYYKDLILKNYAESNFAKVILDPDYNQKLNDQNAAFTSSYTDLFDLIVKRKYTEAVTKANAVIEQFPGSAFLAQVYYLRAIAMGHRQKLDPFKTELDEIVSKFPDDRLITPLVKQHQAFIAANESDLAAREVVLVDTDPNEVLPFMQKQPAYVNPYTPAVPKAQPKPQVVKQNPPANNNPVINKPVTPPVSTPPVANPVVKNTDSATIKPPVIVKETLSIYTAGMADSTNYYFVINVNTNKVNMASSRFGIGQFNRGRYTDNSIRHQLKPANENQLIYVGRFTNLAAVKAYARAIVPLLPEIMTVPADKYNFFIITQQNLDKLADKKTIDNYYDFYQKHY